MILGCPHLNNFVALEKGRGLLFVSGHFDKCLYELVDHLHLCLDY